MGSGVGSAEELEGACSAGGGGGGEVVQCRGRDIMSPRDDMIKGAKVSQGEEVIVEGEGTPAPAINQ